MISFRICLSATLLFLSVLLLPRMLFGQMATINFSRKDLPVDITEAPCLASVECLEFYHDSTKASFARELSKHNIPVKHFFLIGENPRTRSKNFEEANKKREEFSTPYWIHLQQQLNSGYNVGYWLLYIYEAGAPINYYKRPKALFYINGNSLTELFEKFDKCFENDDNGENH